MDFPEIPGYRIQSLLGQGGMASVYLAIQENFERKVALKVMSKHLLTDSSFGQRFLREARILAQMSHQHMVPVFDVGQHNDYHYMAMEYLPGGDLKDLLRKGIELSQGIRIIKEVASGLNYAAGKNFIHRDIKPDNILFREDGSSVISDFGIARNTESETEMTLAGTVIGTPHYMSPEQANAEQLDGRSDLYSLGIIFYEMLAGKVPFSGGSAVSIGIMHITEEIPLLPAEMADFQEFIDKALAKHPDDRFQSGRAMIAALEDVEFHLSDDSEATVVLSNPIQSGTPLRSNSQRASRRTQPRRTLPSGVRTSSNTDTMQTELLQPARGPMSKKVIAASVVAAIVLGSGGWWMLDRSETPMPVAMPSGFESKSKELNQQAIDAMQDGRLYTPASNNAQYYLTTLLALSPGDEQAKESITRLFATYLGEAGAAMDATDWEKANAVLNQASQIAFYIADDSLVEQLQLLRNNLIIRQQKAIIDSQKEEEVQRLLTAAERFLSDDKLTSPPDGNAYSSYQDVLQLDPENVTALEGIKEIASRFLQQAEQQAKAQEFGRARAFMAAAVQVFPRHPDIRKLQDTVTSLEEQQKDALLEAQAQQTSALQAARAEREREKKRRADTIAGLLAEGESLLSAGNLNSPADNNAAAKYKQVLNIDPANVDALNGLDAVAAKLVKQARAAIENGLLDEAEALLKGAQTISPSGPEMLRIQKQLIAARDQAAQEKAASEARQTSIAALLEEAENDTQNGSIYSPINNNALGKLRKVLELDRDNQEAIAFRNRLFANIQSEVRSDIQNQRFDAAQSAIDALIRNKAPRSSVSELQGLLKTAKVPKPKVLSEAEKLLAQARSLGDIAKGNYKRLGELFQGALEQEPGNRAAKRGLENVTQFVAKLAEQAISARDFSGAEQYIAYLTQIGSSSAIEPLKSRMAQLQTAQAKASQLLEEADTLTATPYKKPGMFGNNKKALETLSSAYAKIDEARQIDPAHPALNESLTKLNSKFIEIIAIHIDDADLDEAREFVTESEGKTWPDSQLSDLDLELKKLEKEAENQSGVNVGGF